MSEWTFCSFSRSSLRRTNLTRDECLRVTLLRTALFLGLAARLVTRLVILGALTSAFERRLAFALASGRVDCATGLRFFFEGGLRGRAVFVALGITICRFAARGSWTRSVVGASG